MINPARVKVIIKTITVITVKRNYEHTAFWTSKTV
jgi:hypothetical protein